MNPTRKTIPQKMAATIGCLVACGLLGDERTMEFGMAVWRFGDGLPQNSVRAIAQTKDGFLWVATDNAVSRFDGVDFVTYDFRTMPALSDEGIGAILATRSGSLWVGSTGGHLLELRNGSFTDFTAKLGLESDNHILTLLEDEAGRLWVGTREGVFTFQNGVGSPFTNAPILQKESVRQMMEEPAGTMWFATGAGLICVSNQQTFVYTESATLKTPIVRAFCRTSEGVLWIGTNRGVVRRGRGKPQCFGKAEGLADTTVRSIYEDRYGNTWVGTYGGLNRLVNGRFVSVLNDLGDPFDVVTSFFEDREGNLWIGAKDGLFRFNPRNFKTYISRDGLAHNNVMSVCEDQTGAILFGTWGGGLHRLNNGKLTVMSADNKVGPNNDQILGLCVARDGSLWVGTEYNGGLFHIRTNSVVRYGHTAGITNAVRVILEDRNGAVWIGMSGGLVQFDGRNFVQFGPANGLAGPTIRSLAEGAQGVLWVGTSAGLSRLKDRDFESFTATNGFCNDAVLALREDAAGALWIGTAHHGLYRFCGGRFSNYRSSHGLFNDSIHEILEDDLGNFWMSCRYGVFRVSRRQFDDLDAGRIPRLTCTSYGRADGLVTVECNSVAKPAAWKASDGRLWFATAKGLSVADPRVEPEQRKLEPPIVIEQMLADKRAVDLGPATATASSGGNDVTPAIVGPGLGELEFRFAALSLRSPQKNQFKYKLEPLQTKWIESGSRRFAIYNNLAAGDYRFRVIGCGNEGVWNERGATVPVKVLPHFWQTRWFFVFNIALIIGTTAGIVRFLSVRKFHRRLEQLERERVVEKERARIARDMHDDLGARITEIILLAGKSRKSEDSAKGFNTIAEAAQEMAHNLDALVWAVNPRHDAVDTMVLYITEYAVKFLGRIEVACRLDVPDEIAPLPVSSEVRHGAFLVVKEALNNIAKYAAATEVRLRIITDDKWLTIIIEDNGKGFEAGDTRTFGNGLINMRKRMEAVAGSFELSSQPGKGTRISLGIPLGAARDRRVGGTTN